MDGFPFRWGFDNDHPGTLMACSAPVRTSSFADGVADMWSKDPKTVKSSASGWAWRVAVYGFDQASG